MHDILVDLNAGRVGNLLGDTVNDSAGVATLHFQYSRRSILSAGPFRP